MNTLLSEKELEFLRKCARQSPEGVIVELGTFQGASAAVLCAEASAERVVCIDNWTMQHHGKNNARLTRANLGKLGYKPRIVTGDSHIVPDGIEEVALLFIDTDHWRKVLVRELDAWLSLIVPGGIVALHDYNHPGYPEMKPTIDERFAKWKCLGLIDMLIAFRK